MREDIKNLQDAVNTIRITESMEAEIIQKVKSGAGKKRHPFPRMAAVALVILLLGLLPVPVRALVRSFIQARMEEVPEEEMASIVDEANHSTANADSLSRPYTEEEKRRLKELASLYKKGTFPKGELARVDSVEEAERLGFCFLAPSSMFYLPDRELTDEEMLQIIDFHAKRYYALEQYVEENYGDEYRVQSPREIREQRKEEIAENGGITEEKAVAAAKEWLLKIYGVDGESLECRPLLSEYVPIAGKTLFYRVMYLDASGQQRYSFFIDVEDGGLASAKRYAENGNEAFTAVEEDACLPGLEREAASFAKELLQMTYEDIYAAYYRVDEILSPTVSFLFVRGDGGAFTLEYSWDGSFVGFEESRFSTYQEEYEDRKASAEWTEKMSHGGEERDVSFFLEKVED